MGRAKTPSDLQPIKWTLRPHWNEGLSGSGEGPEGPPTARVGRRSGAGGKAAREERGAGEG